MNATMVTPLALFAVLWGALSESASAEPSAAPPACLPDQAAGPEGLLRYDDAILRQARLRRLNPRLVKAIIAAESQFSPAAVSRCGARGLMQVMPATAQELGVRACDLSDPETNIGAGTEYLARLFKAAERRAEAGGETRAQTVRRVIAAYHSGPRALAPETWTEPTRRYVRTVLGCYGSRVSDVRPPRPARARLAMREGSAW